LKSRYNLDKNELGALLAELGKILGIPPPTQEDIDGELKNYASQNNYIIKAKPNTKGKVTLITYNNNNNNNLGQQELKEKVRFLSNLLSKLKKENGEPLYIPIVNEEEKDKSSLTKEENKFVNDKKKLLKYLIDDDDFDIDSDIDKLKEETILKIKELFREKNPNTKGNRSEITWKDFDFPIFYVILRLFSDELSIYDNLLKELKEGNNEGNKEITLSIPYPIRVMIKRNGVNSYSMGFYQNMGNKEINDIVSKIKKFNTIYSSYVNCDELSQNDVNRRFQNKNVDAFYIVDERSDEEEFPNFHIVALYKKKDGSLEQCIKTEMNDIYDKTKLAFCSKCNCMYPENGVDQTCYKPGQHEGKQIPFDDGEWEIVDMDDDGEPITLKNYECCGEVIVEPPEKVEMGCKLIPQGKHRKQKIQDMKEFHQIKKD